MTALHRPSDLPTRVVWSPSPGPQAALLHCPIEEIFFGGARGGGKTDGVIGEFAIHADEYGASAIGLMVRRDRTQLVEAIERSRAIYTPLGAKFNESEKYWRFPRGGRLRFAYLDRDADADAYQGHGYTRVYPEEVGTFPDKRPIMKLKATLRSAQGAPCKMIATGNPGGPGHLWVRERYIDPAPQGWEFINEEFDNPFTGEKSVSTRVFIPSRLTDNPYLGNDYVARLQQSGSEQLVKAWLLGDWSIIDGAFFDCWSMHRHVVRPFQIPKTWLRFRAIDWGSARPFAVIWFAVVGETTVLDHLRLPAGALVVYREWYGMKPGEANIGLKLTAEEVAAGIRDREAGEASTRPGEPAITYGVADPSMFQVDGGPSIAERMRMDLRPGDNRRVSQAGALSGWDQFRRRLVGLGEDAPMLTFFSTCTHSIRTIPALQHDRDRPEDVDTEGEDHAADAVRYGVMSRPWVASIPKPKRAEQHYVGLPSGRIAGTIPLRNMLLSKKSSGERRWE